jgi:signal transduction histidine kinase
LLLAATLLRRVGFHLSLDRERDAAAIVFLAALGSMLVSASIGASTLVAAGVVPPNDFWVTWSVWWTGDAMGVLVFTPFLLMFRLPPDPATESLARSVELAAMLTATLIVSLLVIQSDLALRFLIFPFLGWGAWRFQLRGTAPAVLVVVVVACWGAVRGIGPFADSSLFDKMASLQAFNATVAFTSIFFAAVVTERSRQREALEAALRSERKATDRLRALDDTRARFLSAASHELRTPITISRGHLQVLPVDATREDVNTTIAVVLEELDRMRRILDDVTALVRSDDAGFLHLEQVDLTQLLRIVASKAQPILSRPIYVADSPAALARVDPQRVTQVLLNLLDNAAAHTPPRSPVQLRVCDDNASWRLEVEDSGRGLMPGSEDAVFDAFSKRAQSKGSGLGLAIVKGIAEAHGGSVGVRNRPGEGAIFWMRVPR